MNSQWSSGTFIDYLCLQSDTRIPQNWTITIPYFDYCSVIYHMWWMRRERKEIGCAMVSMSLKTLRITKSVGLNLLGERSQGISHRQSILRLKTVWDRIPLIAKLGDSRFYLAITNAHMSSIRKAVSG